MPKHNMKWLIGKKEKELQKMYDEYNLIISKVRGEAKANRLEGGTSLKEYNEAVKNRARILTIFNQKRHSRMMTKGGKQWIRNL